MSLISHSNLASPHRSHVTGPPLCCHTGACCQAPAGAAQPEPSVARGAAAAAAHGPGGRARGGRDPGRVGRRADAAPPEPPPQSEQTGSASGAAPERQLRAGEGRTGHGVGGLAMVEVVVKLILNNE